MRLQQLLEYRKLVDLRHENTLDRTAYWPKKENPDYIAPQDGFHFQIAEKGYHHEDFTLYVYSVDNLVYSATVKGWSSAQKNALPWNAISGKVDLTAKTITIAKESYSRGTKSYVRQRFISDIQAFQKVLKSLKPLGVTDDFRVKGVDKMPKTVGEILKLSDPTKELLAGRSIQMYHGTSESRWQLIQRIGLQPGHTGEAYIDLVPGYSDQNVYLATTAKAAEFYGKRQAQKDGDKSYVLLSVDLPDPAKLIADDRYVRYGSEIVSGSTPRALKASGREIGEFAYRGRIAPKFISLLSRRKFVGRTE